MINNQLSPTLSDMVLKRCKEDLSGNPEKKKLRKIKDSVCKLVKDPEVRKEGEKKGRLASESNFNKDKSLTPKNSHMSSPLT